MSAWSLTYRQSVFPRQQSKTFYNSFTYKMAAKTSWHRYGTKLRHCRSMYANYTLFIIIITDHFSCRSSAVGWLCVWLVCLLVRHGKIARFAHSPPPPKKNNPICLNLWPKLGWICLFVQSTLQWRPRDDSARTLCLHIHWMWFSI